MGREARSEDASRRKEQGADRTLEHGWSSRFVVFERGQADGEQARKGALAGSWAWTRPAITARRWALPSARARGSKLRKRARLPRTSFSARALPKASGASGQAGSNESAPGAGPPAGG